MLQLIATLAVISALLGAAERVDPEAGVWTRPDSTQRSIDLIWMGAYVLYAPIVGWIAAGAIETAAETGALSSQLAVLPLAVRLAGAVVVAEFVAYSIHRVMHTVPVLWRVHAVHHGATDLRWWTAFRFHPAETVVMHVVPYTATALIGFGTDVTAILLVAVTVVTMFAHADVHVPGRAFAKLIVTPGYHRSHHEVGRDNTNFALLVPLVDIVFGTAAFKRATPRRFGSSGAGDQAMSSAPTVSDERLASELALNAVAPFGSRRQMIIASSTSTPISTRTSAAVRPVS